MSHRIIPTNSISPIGHLLGEWCAHQIQIRVVHHLEFHHFLTDSYYLKFQSSSQLRLTNSLLLQKFQSHLSSRCFFQFLSTTFFVIVRLNRNCDMNFLNCRSDISISLRFRLFSISPRNWLIANTFSYLN